MDDLDLLIDLHLDGRRQGPGGDDETRLALTLAGLRGRRGLTVADVGCGTGRATRVLARELDARIVAVDLLAPFLDALRATAEHEGLADRIETLEASMDALPFEDRSLDALWSEGAIYNLGFAAGVRAWSRFLKPGGVLAVSELTWLTRERPAELERHWAQEYPEVATAAEKLAVLEEHGFSPLGYFPLPERCWIEEFYAPLRSRFEAFLARHDHSDAARTIVAKEEQEIALYERHAEFVSYGFYVARRSPDR